MRKLLSFLFIISVTILLFSCGKDAVTSSNGEATAIAVESLPILEKQNGEISGVSSASSQPSSGRDTSSLDSSGTETKTPWLSDYDTFWTIVEENYPLYATAERITGKDFAAVKEQYRLQAAEAASAQELCEILDLCVQQFDGTGHFWLATTASGYRSLATLYGRLAADNPKCSHLYNRLNTPASIAYYGVDPSKEIQTIMESGGNKTGEQSSGNLKFKDYPADKTAYVSISGMTADFENNDGKVLEDWFRSLEANGYQNCILDIRENGGGSSSYWTEYIARPNLKEACSVSNYALVKGQASVDYWQAAGKQLEPISTLPLNTLPELQQEDLNGVTHYIHYTEKFEPTGEPLFSGRFWLLVSEKVYSSSEMFAAFCKDTQFATLVGKSTGGDGIGEDPLTFALPNSGICFRFSAEEGLNVDGSCNEELGTQPDIAIKAGEDALEVSLTAIRAGE